LIGGFASQEKTNARIEGLEIDVVRRDRRKDKRQGGMQTGDTERPMLHLKYFPSSGARFLLCIVSDTLGIQTLPYPIEERKREMVRESDAAP